MKNNYKNKKVIFAVAIILISILAIIYAKSIQAESLPATGTERDVDNEKSLVKMNAIQLIGQNSTEKVTIDTLKNGMDRYLGTGKTTVENISGKEALMVTFLETGRQYVVDINTGYVGSNYILTLNPNGGTVSPTTMNVQYNQVYGTLPTPTKSGGYLFLGWFTAASGGEQKTAQSIYEIEGPSTLYAHWKNINYTLTLNANGGSVSPTTKNVQYKQAYGTLPTPTRSQYKFLGWFTAASGGQQKTAQSIYEIDGPSTLYAHWQSMPNQTASFDTGWCYNNNYNPPNYGFQTFEVRGNAGDWSEYLYIDYSFRCVNNTINDGGSDIGFYIDASYDGYSWTNIAGRTSNSSDKTSHTDYLTGTFTNTARYRYFRITTAQVSYHNSGCYFQMNGSFTARYN